MNFNKLNVALWSLCTNFGSANVHWVIDCDRPLFVAISNIGGLVRIGSMYFPNIGGSVRIRSMYHVEMTP